MAKAHDDPRLELLQGTLDMLILRTLQWGRQHGYGIGQAIRGGKVQLVREQDRWSRLVQAIGRVMNPAPADSGT